MTAQPKSRRTGRTLATVAVLLAVASAAVLAWPGSSAPVATFRFGPDRQSVAPFDQVPRYDAMDLQLELPFDAFVYVVSFDYRRGTVSYFPSDFLGTDHKTAAGRMNRLTAGRHELPGPWDDKPQAWFVPDVEGALSLCVVVSKTPLTDLEKQLPLTRQVGNTAFPDRSMGDYMPRAGRDKRIGRRRLPHPILQAAQNQEDSIHAGPMVPCKGHPEVFIKVLNIRPGTPRPGAAPPSNPLRDRLQTIEKRPAGAGNGAAVQPPK